MDRFVAVSEYYADVHGAYLGIPAKKMRTVPLGVNVNDLRPGPEKPPGPFTIGYLARVAPEKGLHNLAEAYRILRRERGLPPSRLVAAGYLAPGDRRYLDRHRDQADRVGPARRVRLRRHGRSHHQDYVSPRSRRALGVQSGYHEPKALYLLEAMACGVPVVEPNHGAFPELLARTGRRYSRGVGTTG